MRPWYRLLFPLLLPACHSTAPKVANTAGSRTIVTDGMVDIGGLSLHIHCIGEGSPLVVMDAGLGSDGSVWKDVQLEVARSTRACVYDRAGMGYSSGPAPTPHTNRQMARELHELLTRSGLDGPYVLVGHSMGGLNVRLFESEHPDQVTGMVLVDSMVDPLRYWSLVPDEEMKKFREMLPKVGEGLDFGTFAGGVADVRASSRSLGAKPLVVLTRGMEDKQPWASAELLAELLRVWQERQADLLKLSSNAIQIVVRNSHHSIQLDAPEMVVAAVGEVVRAVRTQGRVNAAVLASLNRQGE
jgi:pimeloyl-ACP methyl ester carboxylesterase